MRDRCSSADYTVEVSASFQRCAEKCWRKHPDLRERFVQVRAALARDPFLPTLGLHAMRFADGLYAVRLTYSYRLLVRIEGRVIVLVAIGSHEAVYRTREGR